MLSPDAFVHLVRAVGADHVIFGSDSPWSDQKAALDWIRDCEKGGRHGLSDDVALSADDVRLILGENAKKLLHI